MGAVYRKGRLSYLSDDGWYDEKVGNLGSIGLLTTEESGKFTIEGNTSYIYIYTIHDTRTANTHRDGSHRTKYMFAY